MLLLLAFVAPPPLRLPAAQLPHAIAARHCALSSLRMTESVDNSELENEDIPSSDTPVAIEAIVRDEMASLSLLSEEEQDEALPMLLQRVEERATSESGYQFGDVTRAAVEATRGEVQRQLDAEWNMNDLSLLLKIGVFLGATATAPVAGLAAIPAAALLATYGTVLKAELGVRAIQEVGTRLAERAAQGVGDGVRSYTGKDSYRFGDLTEETVHRVTGNDDYKFGGTSTGVEVALRSLSLLACVTRSHCSSLPLRADLTKGTLNKAGAALTGDSDYRFGSLTEGAVKRVTGNEDYKFGDFSKGLFKRMTGGGDDDEKKNKKRK